MSRIAKAKDDIDVGIGMLGVQCTMYNYQLVS